LFLNYLKCCDVYQRGGEMFPKGDNGELIYEDIHYIDTWKVGMS